MLANPVLAEAEVKPIIAVSTGSYNDYRNLLINISIVSAEAKDFIEAERANGATLKIRPTLHVTQITPYGEVKSTLSNLIGEYSQKRENHPFHEVSGVTAASICGSIDEKFRVVPPLSYDFKGGTVVIDEFNPQKNEKASAIGASLSVLEQEKASRNTARMPDEKWLKTFQKLGYNDAEVKNGRIIFRNLRSNWIFLTAKHLEMSRSLQIAMLLSRTVPISFEPSLRELNAIDDNPDLLFKPLDLKVPEFHRIPHSDYKIIRDFVEKGITERNIPPNYYFRTINDCMRCYVFLGYQNDFELYKFILDSKRMFINDYEKIGLDLGRVEYQFDLVSKTEIEGDFA